MLPHTQFILKLLLDPELEPSAAATCGFPYVILSKTYCTQDYIGKSLPLRLYVTLDLEIDQLNRFEALSQKCLFLLAL